MTDEREPADRDAAVDDEPAGSTVERQPVEQPVEQPGDERPSDEQPGDEQPGDEPGGDTAERKPLPREVLDPSSAQAPPAVPAAPASETRPAADPQPSGAHAGPVATEDPAGTQARGAHAASVETDGGLEPAYVKLHLQGNVLISMITPKVAIDGYPAPTHYGENLYPVAPGAHTVAAHAQWIWQYGKAQEQVALAPGETVELWYAAPVITFLAGAMGRSKQSHPGLTILLLLCGVAIAFVVGLVILALGT